mgnify:CR=1 FL=1
MSNHRCYTAERLIAKIFEDARNIGIEFIIFGGWHNGSLDMEVSDVDIFLKSREEMDRFCQIAFKHLGNHVVAIRNSRGGIHIIFRSEEEIFMLDLCTEFRVEHLVYVDSETVFALKKRGHDVEGLLRDLKHMTGVKSSWPYLPPRVYFLREHPVGYVDRLLYWGQKIIRRLSSYVATKDGVMAILLGPDGSGKSTLARKLKEAFSDQKRTIIPSLVFHWAPSSKFQVEQGNQNGIPGVIPYRLPPRGRLSSLLKLAYLFCKFWLGYIISIRPLLSRTGIIIGDRYYDDLLIDPKRYRYGGPMGFARRLRRFIPRPDVFLVLDVPVEKLLERKREVDAEELQRLVEAYRRFALETPNAFLLNGSLPPEEVAREAQDILLDFLHERYLNRRRIWFFQAVEREEEEYLERSLGLRLSKGHPTHAYLSLPDGRGYLLPLRSGRSFRRGLELYPAQGRKARLGKAVLGALARVGLKGPGLPKVCLEEKEDCVFQTLRKVFGRDDLCFAVSLGTPGPHRKPVIQVLTPEGEVLGYAKVGWNEATRELVKHEAEVLKRLGKEELPFRVPEILYANESSGRNLCLQSPPPKDGRPAPRRWTREYAEVLCALASLGVRYKPLEQTAFWQQIVSRVHEVRSLYWRRVLEQAMERVRRDWKDKEVPLHPAHGDFAPWNTLQADGRLYLYDWEYALEEAPAGYDLIHFVVQTLWLVERHVPEEIARTILQYGEEEFQQVLKWLNVESGSLQELLKLYVLEKLSFYSVSEPGDSKQLRLFWTLFQGLG